ncbi:urea transporter 1 [Corythoichthys intestinalis]|uniref:urea transporter 1 n=1 Tax=Corythoichthys intestinalis TaxID=161448 RepID=UPI0025A5B108|nr:urea transporter 1 [Corythoichthys intestinalis]XP_061810955.1 urea transporter 1 [Nerophis lumbriciformis]
MWTDRKADVRDTSGKRARDSSPVLNRLMALTGDMIYLDKVMQDKWFVLQLAVWALRGVTRVILANNPLSGALMLAALYWASPWQGLLGTLGLLTSTLVAVILGQDSAEVWGGLHGFNGMLVSLLMGVFNSAGDWYWWLLLPVCLGSATTVFFFSGLSSVLDRWDLPVAVFPFNIVIVIYFLCTGPDNPYFPRRLAIPPSSVATNVTAVSATEVLQGIPLGVGQIFACGSLGPSFLILAGLCLYSPLQAFHALLGSAVGTLVGLSVAVRHECLYSGLSGFNGALGCMAVGGFFFMFNWKTHLLAIASAFLSAYLDIALSNLLGATGLPACSWAATLTVTLLLLLRGSASAYRIPTGQVKAPEQNLRSRSRWEAGSTVERESTDV